MTAIRYIVWDLTSATVASEISSITLKKILHLWKFPVISQLRTNFAEMPGNRCDPGAAKDIRGDAVVRVSRLRRKP